MDFSKIKLANERNSHVTKRLNRLNTWKFFKVIYRENIWRMFGYNFLMLICVLPIFLVMMYGKMQISGLEQNLPMYNSFGFSTGVWTTVGDYLAARTREHNIFFGWLAVAASALLTIVLSGGLAVIRDAFWTGKLSTVGVFKSMWKGIRANILYAFIANVVISFMVFGIYAMFLWLNTIKLWVAIVVTVVLSLIALLVLMYLLILCSVTVTYKQSVRDNMDDSWRLMWLNILPNLLHLLLTLVPIALYFVFQSITSLGYIFLIILVMFGGLYCPLVWQTHMMKTFALFHPVEVKKKKQAQGATEIEEYPTEPAEQPKPKKKSKKQAKAVEDVEPTTADTTVQEGAAEYQGIAESEADAYAQEEDPYANDEHKN